MIVFLFRPSPQVSEPSLRAARQCFEAARFNIYVQREQIETKSVDLTWIFTQSLFMAINTVLWTLSYPAIRQEHPKEEVESHLQTALDAIYLASRKWPGVESAFQLYLTLVEACRKAYDRDLAIPYNVRTPPSQINEISKPQLDSSRSFTSSPGSTVSSLYPASIHTTSIDHEVKASNHLSVDSEPVIRYARPLEHNIPSMTTSPYSITSATSQQLVFDPRSYSNPLPAPLHYSISPTATESMLERNMFYGSFDNPYAQLLHAEHFHPGQLDGLNLEQQTELMGNLEANGLGGQLREASPGRSLYSIGYVS
jgi:hypothetical protein